MLIALGPESNENWDHASSSSPNVESSATIASPAVSCVCDSGVTVLVAVDPVNVRFSTAVVVGAGVTKCTVFFLPSGECGGTSIVVVVGVAIHAAEAAKSEVDEYGPFCATSVSASVSIGGGGFLIPFPGFPAPEAAEGAR